MRNRILWIYHLLIFCFCFTYAQELEVFNSHKMQPEVYSFPQTITGDVDAKGDLTISVPIMNVPGRNGLDYNISFDYRSSIRVEDVASWIGLGWNFDPGSEIAEWVEVFSDPHFL